MTEGTGVPLAAYQILAAVLTYGAVGLAYAPLIVMSALAEQRAVHAIKVAIMIPLLPVLMVIGSMPSGIITALIIFFGIRQAMRMTAAPLLRISGPFRIGASPSAPTTA